MTTFAHPPRTILLNGSYAPSLLNFRGPLICALIAAGYQVHVSAPHISDEIRGQLEQWGATAHDVPLVRTGLNPFSDLSYFLCLRALIDTIKAERVIGYTIKPSIWGSLAARSKRVSSASMVTGLGYAFIPAKGLRWWLLNRLTRLLWRAGTSANDVVLFQNPDDRDDFIAGGALSDPSKARLVYGSGIDLSHFKPTPLPDEPVFLMISRFLKSKGVREYADAAALLRAEGRPWRFLLVGFLDEGPDAIEASELNHWRAAGIEYLGELADIRPAMTLASVYVLPSYREGTPRTVLEAMAMRRAVITTDAPGCRETTIDGVTGLLVPPRDTAAVAAAMVRLGEDRVLRSTMAQAGLDRARNKYAVDRVNGSIMDFLDL